MCSRDWLQSNIDRLSLTFGRRVVGVHNPTSGILFDILECLVQRDFAYSTQDVREAYVSIKAALYNEKIKKVVFILHSQGGIEGGLILDWLLAEVPQQYLRQLEVYTFGNAANHFNNPQRNVLPSLPGSAANPLPNGLRSLDTGVLKAIGHIEHYANQGDFVAQIGVLNYTSIANRYMGRVFKSPYSGHLLNQHYLHEMFPLDSMRKCADTNEFMEMEVNMNSVRRDSGAREGLGSSMATGGEDDDDVTFIGDVNSPISPLVLSRPDISSLGHDAEPTAAQAGPMKVKHFSRLWLYRNGGVPPDDSVRRAATT
jgi:hypothetical protein